MDEIPGSELDTTTETFSHLDKRLAEIDHIVGLARRDNETPIVDRIIQDRNLIVQALKTPENFQKGLNILIPLIVQPDKRDVDFAAGIIIECSNEIQRRVDESKTVAKYPDYFGTDLYEIQLTMQDLAEHGDPEQRKIAVYFMLNNLDKYMECLPNEWFHNNKNEIVRTIMLFGDKSHYRELFHKVSAYLVSKDRRISKQANSFREMFTDYDDNTVSTRRDHYKVGLSPDKQLEVLEVILEEVGLDPTKTLDAWDQSDENNLILNADRLNIAAIINLENARPGICKELTDQFNIYDFARYSQRVLIAQYDQREQKQLPYGIVIFPRNDHNGHFYQNGTRLDQLYSDIGRKMYIRIYEAENQRDLVHIINSARHSYGLISFAIIGGHGTDDTIQFGPGDSPEDRKNFLLTNDVQRSGASALKLAFVENPSILLISCSTGSLGGIGQEISRIGANVTAPEKDSSVKTLHATVSSDRRVHFQVEYVEDDVNPQTFASGKLNKNL